MPHLVHPVHDFLEPVDAAVNALGLEGELQVAYFQPDYRFAGTAPEDPANCTNRSPYPMLHLLREESVERAVDAFPDPDAGGAEYCDAGEAWSRGSSAVAGGLIVARGGVLGEARGLLFGAEEATSASEGQCAAFDRKKWDNTAIQRC